MVTGASSVSGVCAATPDVLFIIKIIRAIYPSAIKAFKYGFLIICVLYQTYGPKALRSLSDEELTVWYEVGTMIQKEVTKSL